MSDGQFWGFVFYVALAYIAWTLVHSGKRDD